MKQLGAALIEKPGEEGLAREEILQLYDPLHCRNEVFPIELPAREHECSAMGFITPEAAATIEYDYSELNEFVAAILDDMEKESPDHRYQFKGIDIFLSR